MTSSITLKAPRSCEPVNRDLTGITGVADIDAVLRPVQRYVESGGLRPACFPECVLDTDVTTAIVEPDCIVEEHLPGSELAQRIPECARDEQGYVIEASTHDYQMPGDDVHVCHAMLTDDFGATAALSDDMSPECERRGFNLEFKIARRPGHPGQQGSRVTATCSLSAQPSVQCPGLRD